MRRGCCFRRQSCLNAVVRGPWYSGQLSIMPRYEIHIHTRRRITFGEFSHLRVNLSEAILAGPWRGPAPESRRGTAA